MKRIKLLIMASLFLGFSIPSDKEREKVIVSGEVTKIRIKSVKGSKYEVKIRIYCASSTHDDYRNIVLEKFCRIYTPINPELGFRFEEHKCYHIDIIDFSHGILNVSKDSEIESINCI